MRTMHRSTEQRKACSTCTGKSNNHESRGRQPPSVDQCDGTFTLSDERSRRHNTDTSFVSDAGDVQGAVTLQELLPVHLQVVDLDQGEQDEALAARRLQHLNDDGATNV